MVVFQINFIHLHTVDTTKPLAFFVHNCEPLPEAPKPRIQPNDRLPQLVAEMVQKGLNASPKVVNLDPQPQELKLVNNNDTGKEVVTHLFQENLLETLVSVNKAPDIDSQEDHQLIQDTLQLAQMQPQTIQLVQNVPIQNMDTIKLELPSHLQQYTQLVVSELPEHLLMCQSLMFDTSQVIPVTAHALPSHFVQIHSQNLHNQ